MTTDRDDYTEQIITFIVAGYNSARTELIERIKARDYSVRLYLTAVSIIFSAYSVVSVKNLPSELGVEIVFAVIGILGVAMSQSVANHQIKIATIGYFIDCELVEHLSTLNSQVKAIEWESCEINKKTSRLPRKLHYAYYYLIFLSPQVATALVSVHMNYNANQNSYSNYHVLFLVFYMICMFATGTILYISNSVRQKYNAQRKHA